MFSWMICLCFVSFRFKAKENLQRCGNVLFGILITIQAKEHRHSVCFNKFRNFNRSLNKRRMSPAQTITEWTAEKWVDKRVQSKQTPKHKLGNRTNRWSKAQEDARCPSSKSSLSSNGNNAKGNIDSKTREQGWRSGESARLLPMCPGFNSRTRRHMWPGWVCCWFSSQLREVFLRVLRFSPLLKNQHFSNSNSILECTDNFWTSSVNSLVLRG